MTFLNPLTDQRLGLGFGLGKDNSRLLSWGVRGRRFKSSREDKNSLRKPTHCGWFFYASNLTMGKRWQNHGKTHVI